MKGYAGPVFGSTIRNVSPATLPPPDRGHRVISGIRWLQNIWPDWREHHALAMVGTHWPMPRLASRHSAVLHFTDRESLEGLTDPAQFARRVSLSLRDHDHCQRYGCIIIEFIIPDPALVQIPPAAPGTVVGRTHRGAREWVYNGNIELSAQTELIYVDPNGPMHYYIPLD